MAEFVTVADRRLRDAQPLGDVSLGYGAGDPVGIGMPAQRNQHTLAARGGERFREAACARFRWRQIRRRYASDRFVHCGGNCGHDCPGQYRLRPLLTRCAPMERTDDAKAAELRKCSEKKQDRSRLRGVPTHGAGLSGRALNVRLW